MIINGTVVSVEIDVNVAKKDGGNYPGSRLTYRDSTGKICEQAFHNNAFKFNAPLKTSLVSLVVGDNIEIEKEKKGDFWNVLNIRKVEGNTAAATTGTTVSAVRATSSPKSTYETPDERAKKQVYIVRQSSLSAALNFSELTGNKKATKEDIVNLAEFFEAFVFGTNFNDGDIGAVTRMEENEDDIIQ